MSEDLEGSGGLRQRREAIVLEHMESENRQDFDATIGTFSHPRYELVPTGDVFDGEVEVRGYFADSRASSSYATSAEADQQAPETRPGALTGLV